MSAGLVKSLALDKRKEVASLPLDFRAERDDQQRVTGLSNGQRVMLRAGLKKLQILGERFEGSGPDKHPKLLVVCEDTSVTPHVVEFLKTTGLGDGDILAVDSNRKGEMNKSEWDATRERLFDIDRHEHPKVDWRCCRHHQCSAPFREMLGRRADGMAFNLGHQSCIRFGDSANPVFHGLKTAKLETLTN